MKYGSSLVTTGLMKRVVNANKNLVLTVAEVKDLDKSNYAFNPCSLNEVLEMGQASQWGGKKQKYFNVLEENISPPTKSSFLDLEQPSKLNKFSL